MINKVLVIVFAGIFSFVLPSCDDTNPPEDVLFLFPGGGEIFYTGTDLRITWNASRFERVDLELYMGLELITTIASDMSNSSEFRWKIPKDTPEGIGYAIKVSNAQNLKHSVISGSFEIRAPGEKSELTDHRDGQTYMIVQIGNQWWMAENFNLFCEGSYCYKESTANCDLYGRLYTLEAAMEFAPPGWHLPSDEEWKELETYLGVDQEEIDAFGGRGRFSGILLGVGGGTGFNAQLGGYQNNCVGNKFGHKVWEAHLWSSDLTREGKPIVRIIFNKSGEIARIATICHSASSVRYVKDQEL